MTNTPSQYPKAGMQTSPWIILGPTLILLTVVIVLAIQNTSREKRSMTEILRAKGAALIRAVEAGTRTGMMGMMWGSQQIQRLLEETGRLPDVRYVALVDGQGRIVAHSDPSRLNTAFRSNGGEPIRLVPDQQEIWELLDLGNNQRVFEMHRNFRPILLGGGRDGQRRRGMMHRRGRGRGPAEDWFVSGKNQQLLIVVGLDTAPFEQAIEKDIRTTMMISAVLVLLGFGGFLSLFWMNSYRATKRRLQDTSAFADEVVAHLPVGLIAFDGEGRITFFNAAAEQITGLTAAQAIRGRTDELLPVQLNSLKKQLEVERSINEKEMVCGFSGGRRIPVSVSATRITNAVGQFVGYILILRDLEEVHRLQEEVRRQEKLAALGGLAAGVAHEIRNPLSSIKGLATFFGEQFDDGSEAKEAAGVMVTEVDRLNRVITELLDYSRPTDIKPQPTRLAPLLSHSLQLIQQDTQNHNIQVKVDMEDDICPVLVDPDRLSQCLLNLYLNAIQAMPDGGTLTLIGHRHENNHVKIVVSDTGRGMAEDHLNKIFNPYYTTKGKGTGLGLAIVHKIVEAHKGRITVDSAPAVGSTFTIILPCVEADER